MMLNEEDLEATAVVANNRMNRERQLRGPNGYDRDLGFDVVDLLQEAGESAAWLDACCGSGRALFEAELLLPTATLVGVDLVGMWWPHRSDSSVQLVGTALRLFGTERRFDLVTSVHGLPYVGDKLGTLLRLRSWLKPGGRLAAHLDLAHVFVDGRPAGPGLLRELGFTWNRRRHLVHAIGPPPGIAVAPVFLGATEAGPTFAGQPGVVSRYRRQ
jgi:SAM-dependent methyltransferase